MTRRSGSSTRRPDPNPAGAGALLIGAIIGCAAIGLVAGLAIGAPVVLALGGGFAGVGVGFRLVHDRFRDL